MKNAGKIGAVVFDLDGTLLRTEHLQWKGWNAALKKYGQRLTRAQYGKYAGHMGHEIETDLLARFGLSARARLGALLAAKEKFLHSHFSRSPLHWSCGARRALHFCRSRSLPAGVATGSKRKEMMKKLTRLGAAARFDARVSLEDVKKGKPAPDLYLAACRRLRVRPQNALAFEDTASGVLSASRAGLRVIAIPTPYSQGQDFSRAWAVCKDFKQALARMNHLLRR